MEVIIRSGFGFMIRNPKMKNLLKPPLRLKKKKSS
jgi:hypothetical protein